MRRLFLLGIMFISLLFVRHALSWEPENTHYNLSIYAAEKSVLGKDKGDYLKNLGFKKGLIENIYWNEKKKYIQDWIGEGANLEDSGGFMFWQLPSRSVNHFHDPLEIWEEAGLNDIKTGMSSLLWIQDSQNQSSYAAGDGDWSWKTIRNYYYSALTAGTDVQRQENLAKTFRGLGHQMHLIEDSAHDDTYPVITKSFTITFTIS